MTGNQDCLKVFDYIFIAREKDGLAVLFSFEFETLDVRPSIWGTRKREAKSIELKEVERKRNGREYNK